MTKQFYTYIHCRPDGTPFYVGKGFGKRAYLLKRRNPMHSNILAKYGNTIKIYVFNCDSEQQALSDEVLQIRQLRSEGYSLANITDGGDGVTGLVLSEEARKKISNRNKGRKATAEENAAKSARMKGVKHPPERCKTKSLALLGKPKSEEIRSKISASLKGKYYQAKVSCLKCKKEGYVTGMVSSHFPHCKGNYE